MPEADANEDMRTGLPILKAPSPLRSAGAVQTIVPHSRSHSISDGLFGLRWQAKRDTAFFDPHKWIGLVIPKAQNAALLRFMATWRNPGGETPSNAIGTPAPQSRFTFHASRFTHPLGCTATNS